MSLVKKILGGIADPLTHICNVSFKLGTFPDKMKAVKVFPTYKASDKHLFTNYTPVSLLPQFLKMLQKLLVKRRDEFVKKKKKKLLVDNQYGFRTGRSRYGIRGVALEWNESDIENRLRFVQVGQHKSKSLNIICSIPQGSVSGLKLINDICKVSDILKFVFADDTNIICFGGDLQKLSEVVTKEMYKLKCWFDTDKLSLNE